MQFFRLQIKQSVFLWSIKCHTRENNGCDFGCLSLGTVSHHTSPLQSFADPGEGPAPLLFLDQTEDQRAEKIFLENSPPPPPISGPGWSLLPLQWSVLATSGQSDSAQTVSNGLLISLWCTTCLAEEASTCKFQRGCCLHIILRSNGSYKLKVPRAKCKNHRDRAFPLFL